MPADPARIGFVLQPVRRATAADPAVTAIHGKIARRDEEPAETFFGSTDDAETIAAERLALLSPNRRRFAVTARGLDEALELPIAGPEVPQGRYIDEERGIDRDVLIAEIGFDFAAQRASFVPWG